MAIVGNTKHLTLLEVARRADPQGKGVAVVAEVLSQNNNILKDAHPWLEANGFGDHKIIRRSSLPKGTWKRLNEGADIEKSSTHEVIEPIGILISFAESDVDVLDMAKNRNEARMIEITAFLEGMGQTLATAMFNADPNEDPAQFRGLRPRLPLLQTQKNVRFPANAGGHRRSLYIVQWGATKVHMIYPMGNKYSGISHIDMGIVPTAYSGGDSYTSADRKMLETQIDRFKVKAGMCVRDERCIARYGRVDPTAAVDGPGYPDPKAIIDLLDNMYDVGEGSTIYCGTQMFSVIDKLAYDRQAGSVQMDSPFGRHQKYFFGYPLSLCQCLDNDDPDGV